MWKFDEIINFTNNEECKEITNLLYEYIKSFNENFNDILKSYLSKRDDNKLIIYDFNVYNKNKYNEFICLFSIGLNLSSPNKFCFILRDEFRICNNLILIKEWIDKEINSFECLNKLNTLYYK